MTQSRRISLLCWNWIHIPATRCLEWWNSFLAIHLIKVWWCQIENCVENEEDKHKYAQKVAPDIYAFVMYHKETFENFFATVKTDSIPRRYKFIVDHVERYFFNSSNKWNLMFVILFPPFAFWWGCLLHVIWFINITVWWE